ncbi:MAG: endonuclease/exonuclease/phosphatase family protein [Bryobacterales bacterium]
MRLALPLLALSACVAHAPAPDGDDDALARRWDKVRVVTWNIETVGTPGSAEYDAALDVLGRLDADVVALQEIASAADDANLVDLAADAGYADLAIGTSQFGGDHVAILSRRALLDVAVLDAPTLSGDPLAADLTRDFLRVEVQTRGAPLVVVTNHWKCCSGDTYEFRRTVESRRAAQAVAAYDPATDPVLVLGDFNEDPADLPLFPASFGAMPSGLPGSYWLGADLYGELTGPGLDNDPLAPLFDAGLPRIPFAQRDGALDTFIAGGTLDLAFLSPAAPLTAAEIYDDRDEGLPSALHLTTAPLPAGTVATASDHHPLALEIKVRR